MVSKLSEFVEHSAVGTKCNGNVSYDLGQFGPERGRHVSAWAETLSFISRSTLSENGFPPEGAAGASK